VPLVAICTISTLVPKGAKAEGLSADPPIVDTSEGDAITVNWEKAHFLTVGTGNSHVKFFGNLWYSKRVPDYYVELTLSAASATARQRTVVVPMGIKRC
jgi:hypothetical protein